MELKNKSAFSGALIYLARRPRTIYEVAEWLSRKGVPEEDHSPIIEKLTSLKLLNDFEYACSFIRTRNLIKPRSTRVLRMELLKKGVSAADINAALEVVPVDETLFARQILAKNEWKWTALEKRAQNQKKKEFLLRKGYSWKIINNIGIDN